MVAALHAKGLRVVLDVVYNHTLGSGPVGKDSVLDKCVPGYYHRRAEDGAYEASTCMNNTAAERAMMERLYYCYYCYYCYYYYYHYYYHYYHYYHYYYDYGIMNSIGIHARGVLV